MRSIDEFFYKQRPEGLVASQQVGDEVVNFTIGYFVPELWRVVLTAAKSTSPVQEQSISRLFEDRQLPLYEIRETPLFEPLGIRHEQYAQAIVTSPLIASSARPDPEAATLLGRFSTWSVAKAFVAAQTAADQQGAIRIGSLMAVCTLVPWPLSEIIC